MLRQLDEERFIVKASNGPRYVVGCRRKVRPPAPPPAPATHRRGLAQVDKGKLEAGSRVALDMMTLTVMRQLPREVDPSVFGMVSEEGGKVSWSDVGGLNDQIREVREVIELPLTNPELFSRVGIKPPKGVLLYGPPGTGKTLVARALASNMNATFLKVVASGIVDKYIGESARIVREMFGAGLSPHFPSATPVLTMRVRLRLREGPRALRDLHGRDRRNWGKAKLGGVLR